MSETSAKKTKSETCPHCGYCSHCGRSNSYPWYQRPWPYYPSWTWTAGNNVPLSTTTPLTSGNVWTTNATEACDADH